MNGQHRPIRKKLRPASKMPVRNAGTTRAVDANMKSRWGAYAAQATACLLVLQLVWALVEPNDAVSVFRGYALPQNLLWMVMSVLVAISAFFGGVFLRLRSWELAVLLALLGTWGVASVMAGNENNPRIAWFGFWQLVSVVTAFAIARSFVGRATDRHRNHRVVLTCVLLAGCIGLSIQSAYEIMVVMPAQRAEYLEDPEAYLSRNPAFYSPPGSPERKRFEDRFLGSKEPLATFALTNSLAVLLTVGIVLGVGCLVAPVAGKHARLQDDSRLGIVVLSLAIGGVMLVWFLTRSRTAYVAFGAAVCYGLAMRRLAKRNQASGGQASGGQGLGLKARWALIGLAVLGCGCVTWILSNDRLVLSQSLYSLRFRLDYWNGCAAMLWDHWMFGVGLGNFQSYYPYYMLETASETIADPHNWLLDIAVSLGGPTAVAALLFVANVVLPRPDQEVGASEVETDSPDVVRAMLVGAIGGGLLVIVAVAMLSGTDGLPLVVGFGIGGVVAWLIRERVRMALSEQSVVLSTAAFAMSVCLLASGSWQASGLAIPMAILFAMALPVSNRVESGAALAPSGWAGQALRCSPVLFATFGLVIFALQTWLPVTSGWVLTQQLQDASTSAQRLELATQLEKADWLDSGGSGIRAQVLVELVSEGRGNLEDAREATRWWLSRDPRPFGNWQFATALMLDLAAASNESDRSNQLVVAAAYAKEAVDRYPSSVGLNVQAALCSALAGDSKAKAGYLEEAGRLSDQTPHQDKKLAMQQVYFPESIARAFPTAPAANPSGRLNAELVAQWLRKN